jgi:hypothetical protein
MPPYNLHYAEMVKDIENHSNEDFRKPAKARNRLLVNGGFIVDRIQ